MQDCNICTYMCNHNQNLYPQAPIGFKGFKWVVTRSTKCFHGSLSSILVGIEKNLYIIYQNNTTWNWKSLHPSCFTYKIGELRQHIGLGFFCWGRSLENTHRNRKGVVYISFRSTVENFWWRDSLCSECRLAVLGS